MIQLNRRFLCFLGFIVILYACSYSPPYEVERGGVSRYLADSPEAYMDAHGFLDEKGQAFIQLDLDVVQGSLIYTSQNDTFSSKIDIHLFITPKTNEEESRSYSYSFRIQSLESSIVYSQERFIFSNRYDVFPGEYLVEVLVTDKTSDKSSSLKVETYIPDPSHPQINLTSIRMLYKEVGESNYKTAKGI